MLQTHGLPYSQANQALVLSHKSEKGEHIAGGLCEVKDFDPSLGYRPA